MSPTIVEGLCIGRIWGWGRPLLYCRGGGVVCNETGKLSELDRLGLCMWSGFGAVLGMSLFSWCRFWGVGFFYGREPCDLLIIFLNFFLSGRSCLDNL